MGHERKRRESHEDGDHDHDMAMDCSMCMMEDDMMMEGDMRKRRAAHEPSDDCPMECKEMAKTCMKKHKKGKKYSKMMKEMRMMDPANWEQCMCDAEGAMKASEGVHHQMAGMFMMYHQCKNFVEHHDHFAMKMEMGVKEMCKDDKKKDDKKNDEKKKDKKKKDDKKENDQKKGGNNKNNNNKNKNKKN